MVLVSEFHGVILHQPVRLFKVCRSQQHSLYGVASLPS